MDGTRPLRALAGGRGRDLRQPRRSYRFGTSRPGTRRSMETSGVTPGTWITAPDLADLALDDGPFATVQLAIDSDVENASQRNQLRWKGARDALAEQGTPESALAAIDELVPDAHLEGRTLIAV